MRRRVFAGLDVVVENPAGSSRQWHDRAAGRSGTVRMLHDYGYLDGHVGSDGEDVDVYLGPDEAAPFVHVVHQLAAPNFVRHDEDKVMLGFADEATARAAYLAHRDDGDRAYGGMTSMPLERFKAKLSRRTGGGKIRHDRGLGMVLFRIEHRGSKWVVLPETGDRVLGTHDTKEEAEKQLAAIEASKARAAHAQTFDNVRGPDGLVREGVWDRVCVPGHDEKDGMSTDFDARTLGQMVDNFVARGDLIPIDYNHQSNFAHENGQPAPALGFYGALAVVQGGQITKLGVAREASANGSEPGLDLSRDGLWAYRCVVTELGQTLLPNFRLLSPTFTPDGTSRDGAPIGYCLVAVAATNSPWQSGTQITFEKPAVLTAKEGRMTPEMMAKLGLHEGSSPEEKDAAFAAYFAAAEAEKAAKLEGDKLADGPVEKMSQFDTKVPYGKYTIVKKDNGDFEIWQANIKVGKAKSWLEAVDLIENGQTKPLGAAGYEQGTEKKDEDAKMDDDSAEKDAEKDAKMAAMSASNAALLKRLERLEAEEARREKEARLADERRFEGLADQAIAGGYPAAQRAALVKFARSDFNAARETVAAFLPKVAPAALFERATRAGAPVGGESSNREFAAAPRPRVVKMQNGLKFVEPDADFATEIERVADSKDPVLMAKVDKLLAPHERAVKYTRLLAAERVVRAERPDLAGDDAE